jgi:hypothetical protein
MSCVLNHCNLSDVQRSITSYLKKLQVCDTESKLLSAIPDGLFLEHYVSLRLLLRRYVHCCEIFKFTCPCHIYVVAVIVVMRDTIDREIFVVPSKQFSHKNFCNFMQDENDKKYHEYSNYILLFNSHGWWIFPHTNNIHGVSCQQEHLIWTKILL